MSDANLSLLKAFNETTFHLWPDDDDGHPHDTSSMDGSDIPEPPSIFGLFMCGLTNSGIGYVEAAALARLKLYEGISLAHDKLKRMAVLDALKVLRLQEDPKDCLLGHFSKEVGWNRYAPIKAVDLLAPYRRGGKIGLFGGAGVLIMQLINNVAKAYAGGFFVFDGVGEHNDLYKKMIEGGVIKLGDQQADRKCALVPQIGAPARVDLTGLTVFVADTEHFCDVEGQVVLLMSNIFHFIQANSEVDALVGRIPSAVGYQPTLATDLGVLEDGSITCVQTKFVPAHVLIKPGLATTSAHLDATTVLSPQDDLPDQSLCMIEGIEEVIAKADKIAEELQLKLVYLVSLHC